tara:strand:- start:9482 stop:9886 length:405 start_codon:yes stop_codon:yes gene_type:complete
MALIPKGYKIYSILYNYCPQCHEGRFWATNNPFKNVLLKDDGTSKYCNKCKLKFDLEVGFWYGAMYVSYALGVFILVVSWIMVLVLFPEIEIEHEIAIISGAILLFAPLNYHLSRLIWINFFIHYKKFVNGKKK